ncbi:uncharacterized protein APUU_40437A [Aspergillus puulaauensis]|uniref:Complex III subunit 9 n=1 Tax=Aspergillus puulaauensis TaxID=1220207 RepID=A0A7R8ANP0_9EURO|nr:uncharacterized protein APUU_40437A [Aspergillus puulaauensis]BCS23993.1 hypothetical protein APUU_40437A [Aspergillus puulaauensis]
MHNIKTRLANQRVGDSRCFSFKPQIRQPPRRPFRREHLSLFAPPHPLPSSLVACIRHDGRRIRCFSLPARLPFPGPRRMKLAAVLLALLTTEFSTTYRTLIRRNAVYLTSIFAGAFAFEVCVS